MRFHPAQDELSTLAKTLDALERPVIIAGGGCLASNAQNEFSALANRLQAAIFCTASGRGILSEDHPHFLGLLGLYLSQPADEILKEADGIFFIGSQCEETALMGLNELLKDKIIIQLNVAPEDIGRGLPCHLGLVGDAKATISALLPFMQSFSVKSSWQTHITEVKRLQHQHLKHTQLSFTQSPVRKLFNALPLAFGKSLHLVLENGLHDMWGYFYPVYESHGGKNYSPGEHTGLGLALGNTIGVKLAHPQESVVTIVGDGAFNFGKSALALAKQLGITFIVINNRGFSWPRLMQNTMNVSVGCEFNIGDLATIAAEHGLHYASIDQEVSLLPVLRETARLNQQQISALIEIQINPTQDIPVGVITHFSVGQ